MRILLAAVYQMRMPRQGPRFNKLTPAQQWHRLNVHNLLESYHYIQTGGTVDLIRRDGVRVFLDSGAFSAWKKHVPLDIKEYCRFIQRNADVIECASVLDVIGDAQGTWENQQAMERLGTRPLPCFHFGEDHRWCDWYSSRYEHMTIGGMVSRKPKDLEPWLDDIWERYLLDGAGRPKVRVHGFGLTYQPLMSRYPWYSVDSTDWVKTPRMVGGIRHPDLGLIVLSAKSEARKSEGRHFDTLSPIEKERLVAEFARLGFTLAELQDEYDSRQVYCMWAYTELERRFTEMQRNGNYQRLLF